MALYSVVAPYTKRGTMTFILGSGYPATTVEEFLTWLDQNSFSSSADVILEIPNGTVLSKPIKLEGYYPYLTIRVATGGTCFVNSDALPKYVVFPSAQSGVTNQGVTPSNGLLVTLTAAGTNPIVPGTVVVPGFTVVTTAPASATEVQIDLQYGTLQFFSSGVATTPITVQYKYYLYALPFFIYNRAIEYVYSGATLPQYGLKAIYGTFQKSGSQSATFCFLFLDSNVALGLSAIPGLGGTAKPLTLVGFEQGAFIQCSLAVQGNIRVTCPTAAAMPISFGSYFAISSISTSLVIEPYGVVSVLTNMQSFLQISGINSDITLYTGTVPFDIQTPNFITSSGNRIDVAMYVISGSGGNLDNCSVTCTNEAYNVRSGTLIIEHGLLIKSNLSTHFSSDVILGRVQTGAKLLFQNYSGLGITQNLELLFDASLGLGGLTPLFYGTNDCEIMYPDDLVVTVSGGGANQNKIALGNNGGRCLSRFSTASAVQNYSTKLQNNELSVLSYLNSYGSRIVVSEYDENCQESYGLPIQIESAEILAGVTVGDLTTRPQDALGSGLIQIYTDSNIFYTAPSYLVINVGGFPLGKTLVQKSGSGAVVDIDSWLLGYPSNLCYLTSTMTWNPVDFTVENGWSESMSYSPVPGSNTAISVPVSQVNFRASGAVTGADIPFSAGLRPGDSIRFTNTSAYTIDGTFSLPAELLSVAFSLVSGASATVTFGWDEGTLARTIFVS